MSKKQPGRINELLLAAADALDDGRDPFSTEWLSTNNVTADECFALSESMAVAVRNYARLAPVGKLEAIIRSECKDDGEREAMLSGLRTSVKHREVMDKLKALSK